MSKTDPQRRRIEEYGNSEANIETSWLREAIVNLRRPIAYGTGANIDSATWKKWRIIVGMYLKDAEGNAVLNKKTKQLQGDKRRQCTQRQAALLVMVGLWKPAGRPFIKDVLESEFNVSQLHSGNIRGLFNQWIEATGGVEAQPVLESIFKQTRCMTGSDLSDLSEYMTPGKRVPVGNLARLVREPLYSDRPCSRAATEKIIQWLINRAHRLHKENAKSWKRQSRSDYYPQLSSAS